jgi:hypothetical protein
MHQLAFLLHRTKLERYQVYVYVVQQVARNVLAKWKEAGAEGDPNELRKLFLKQSLVPISATLVQVR